MHKRSQNDSDADRTPKRSRFEDEEDATPSMRSTRGFVSTPKGEQDESTPRMVNHVASPKAERSEPRHKFFEISDEDLNALLPSVDYEIVLQPAGYQREVGEETSSGFFEIPKVTKLTGARKAEEFGASVVYEGAGEMPEVRPEDMQLFAALLKDASDENMTPEQAKDRRILALLLKIKNGTPSMRKQATKLLVENAKSLGPEALFNAILPLLMSSTIEDQERHVLVKVIDRLLYKLQEEVRPFVHKILVVIEPLLVDEDYFARAEGKEVISNLAKAAGLPTMIATMRPDIDHPDDYVRNTTARAFAVVASALGIQSILPFLKAVSASRKSWQARHTGAKIVQQIAFLVGSGILPFLRQTVEIIGPGLTDEHQKVRTISALAIAALAEASYPYGIECFESVLKPLWQGAQEHRGKALSAFIKSIGFLIPLMDAEQAGFYTREILTVLIREFSTPDDDMKRVILKAIEQCCGTVGVEAEFVKTEILSKFFEQFWVIRNTLEKRNYDAVVQCTVSLAGKVGPLELIEKLVLFLKDSSESFRKMTLETLHKIVDAHGMTDASPRIEEQMVDGLIYSLQEQQADDAFVLLNGCGLIIEKMGIRVKPYLQQIAGILRWRLNQPSTKSRQNAADLIAKIANVLHVCNEEKMLANMGLFLFEFLGEEYPEVLGSLLGALRAIVNVIGMPNMTPPISELLPRLTPILKNRHEKVQENCIELIGRIADRGADFVPAKEWNRIVFDLLELLKAPKKSVRRAATLTFGYIARAIGPHDVIGVLLNNLKVQERQLRVCTTVAIAIVADTCGPFTVLPAMMNEYKTPDLLVQNGILKAISFMLEYIGPVAKDYVYALTPLIEDGLTDRDLTHRQTAAWAVKHLALGVAGLDCEDSLQHLFNYIWPNIFEVAPHMIQSFFDAVDALRLALGPGKILAYIVTGLFHPARRVREAYWRVYNYLYMSSQPALVQYYPKFEDEGDKKYRCRVLEHIL